MPSKASAVGLLAVAGVVLGHTVGYTVAHPTAGPTAGHAYLDLLSFVVLPAGAAALAALAVRSARASGLVGLEWRRLAVLQVVLFSMLEVYERFVVGTLDTLLSEPGVALGLLAQLPVAALLVWLVRAGARVVARYLTGAPDPPPVPAPVPTPVVPSLSPVSVAAPRFRRGPPARLD